MIASGAITVIMNRWKILVASVAAAVVATGCGTTGRAGRLASQSPRPAARSQPAGSPAGGRGAMGRVLAQIRVGAYPDGIIAAFGSLWTANLNAGSVSRIDPATRQVTATISLLAADGAIWAADYDGATVTRIDPAAGRVTGRIGVGPKPVSLLLARGLLWVFNQGNDTASVVDPHTVRVVRTVRTGVAAGFASGYDGLLWV